MDCIFCEDLEVKKRIVLDNQEAFAFLTNIPIVDGHILICPKRHAKYYEDLTQSEKNAIEKLRIKLNEILKKTFKAEGFNYAWNEGAIAGQSVPHLHLHIIPRKQDDNGVHNYDPRRFLYRPGSREQSSFDDLVRVANLIKKNIKLI